MLATIVVAADCRRCRALAQACQEGRDVTL